MEIITEPTSLQKLWEHRIIDFSGMMKIVVDIEMGLLAIDGDMHADLESLLLENGSLQENLWGANIYPMKKDEDFLEFTSFINIRPSMGNRSMEIINVEIRKTIIAIVEKLLKR